MLSQQVVQTDLDLNPQLTPEAEGSFFPIALVLLPFTLLLEDLGIRLLPWLLLKPLSRMDVEEKRSWRIWLYLHVFTIYIVVSALWHSSLHQTNIFTANSLGILAYFGIQLIAGSLLAWIFIRKGFWQSYTIHISWDLLIVGVVILSSLLSSL